MPRIGGEGQLTLVSVSSAQREVGCDLRYEGSEDGWQIAFETACCGKVSGTCLPRDDDGGLVVDCDRVSLVASGTSQIGPESHGRQRGVHFSDESIHGPGVCISNRVLNGKILRRREAGDIYITMEIKCQGVDSFAQPTTEEDRKK